MNYENSVLTLTVGTEFFFTPIIILTFIGEKPEDCLVVEDAMAGIEAAYRGGFKSAGLGEANNHEHVTYKMDSFSDLLKLEI